MGDDCHLFYKPAKGELEKALQDLNGWIGHASSVTYDRLFGDWLFSQHPGQWRSQEN
jgi:hypothetical protein